MSEQCRDCDIEYLDSDTCMDCRVAERREHNATKRKLRRWRKAVKAISELGQTESWWVSTDHRLQAIVDAMRRGDLDDLESAVGVK